MKKKILLAVWPYKFTSFTYKKMEFDLLEKKFNIKVVVSDLSNIINKNFRKTFKLKNAVNTKNFDSIKSWSIYFKKLKKKNNVFIYNWIDDSGLSALKITNIIKSSKLPTIMLASPQLADGKRKKNLQFYKHRIKTFFKHFGLVLYYLKVIFFKFCFNLNKFENLFLFTAGNTKKIRTIEAKKKTIIPVHSNDYSNFLVLKKKIKRRKNIVFLDMPQPFFKDDSAYLGFSYNYKTIEWYNDLNKFFDFLENKYSSKVIVIPHPKVRNVKNPFFGQKNKRIVDHSLDAAQKQIPNSKFIISHSNVTTAISFAIASYTPILFTYCDQVSSNYKIMNDLKDVSNTTGSPLMSINNFNKKNFGNFKVNRKKYNHYKYQYPHL